MKDNHDGLDSRRMEGDVDSTLNCPRADVMSSPPDTRQYDASTDFGTAGSTKYAVSALDASAKVWYNTCFAQEPTCKGLMRLGHVFWHTAGAGDHAPTLHVVEAVGQVRILQKTSRGKRKQ